MQKRIYSIVCFCLSCILTSTLFGQSANCFLMDFQPKPAVIPLSIPAERITAGPTVGINLSSDTITPISKYIFGNAIAVWMGNVIDDPTFVNQTKTLAPTLIRFPGGSWSDIFFWNGRPADLPDSLYDGITGKKATFYSISGKNDWSTTVDNYYTLLQQVGTQGLITINYGYARYGMSSNPVAAAAHLAADWVRYDKGRTRFWEIGNENAGPWEAGYMIDVKTNKDGQPSIITGELYAQHFRVFADSMRKAATQVGAEIFIGGQIMHFDAANSWNQVDKTWNVDFFRIVGDGADFYVMHNYFGSTATVDALLSIAQTEPKMNGDFIRQDIAQKKAFSKPIALTEYNMSGELKNAVTSHVNGMQVVILFNELIKNKFSLSARWLLATGESGMFYQGGNASLLWQPRPEFYYAYYQQKFSGDHMITARSSNPSVWAYSSKFSTGETGVIVVNTTELTKVVNVKPNNIGVGNRYYVFSLNGGTDNGEFSQQVFINGIGPSGTQWGPVEQLRSIPANAYALEDSIKVISPGRSVQFILVESGTKKLYVNSAPTLHAEENLCCYPNPFKEQTTIDFQTSGSGLVSLDIFNSLGLKIATLVHEKMPSGKHSVKFNTENLPKGICFCTLRSEGYTLIKKIQRH